MTKIYVIGDSISILYGPYLKSYLKGIAEYARKEGEEEALLNLDNPQGANGGDSSMVLSFLRKRAQRGIDADYILINCGLHDIKTIPGTNKRQVPLEQYIDNLNKIVRLVAGIKPELIWIRTTPCDEKIHNHPKMSFHRFSRDCDEYNRQADKIMQSHGIPVIDLYTFTKNLGEDLYFDHIHFNDHIQQKQAAFIAGWLSAFIETGKSLTTPFSGSNAT